jgi:hypothetical protein
MSEIVKDEISTDASRPELQRRSILVQSSCPSPRWNVRTQNHVVSCPIDHKDSAGFENTRLRAAETLVKTELGEVPEGGMPMLGAEIVGPTGKRMTALCGVDLSFPGTLLHPEIAKLLELAPTGEVYCHGVGSNVQKIPVLRGAIKWGEKQIETKFLPMTYSGPVVLGGDFFQKYLQGKEKLIQELVMADHMRTLLSAARCKKNYVLILGKYGKERNRLTTIKRALNSQGLVGLILDEYPDIEEQSLTEKMVAYSTMCRFNLVDDLAPSGHIKELAICHELKFVTAVLRLKGLAATAMQADVADEVSYIQEFSYDDDAELETVVNSAASWANEAVTSRAHDLNRKYSQWRNPHTMMHI